MDSTHPTKAGVFTSRNLRNKKILKILKREDYPMITNIAVKNTENIVEKSQNINKEFEGLVPGSKEYWHKIASHLREIEIEN